MKTYKENEVNMWKKDHTEDRERERKRRTRITAYRFEADEREEAEQLAHELKSFVQSCAEGGWIVFVKVED